MAQDVIRAMPEEDWKLLEGLVLALRNVSGGGSISANLVPGVGLVISGGGNNRAPEPEETWAMVRLTGDGESDGFYVAEEVWWDAEKAGGADWVAIDVGRVWDASAEGADGKLGDVRELSGRTGLSSGESPVYLARLVYRKDGSAEWVFVAGGGGAAVELFEVVSQTAGVKVVGKMLVGGEVPEGAENVDLLAPLVAWKVEAADTVAGYQLPDGTWRLLSEPPASAAVYQSPQVDSDGLLIFDYPRAHA